MWKCLTIGVHRGGDHSSSRGLSAHDAIGIDRRLQQLPASACVTTHSCMILARSATDTTHPVNAYE